MCWGHIFVLIIVTGTVFTLGAMKDLVLIDSVFRNSVLPSDLLSRLNYLPYLFPLLWALLISITILLLAIPIFAAVSYAHMVERGSRFLFTFFFFLKLCPHCVIRGFSLCSDLASYARFCIDIVSRPSGFIAMSRRGELLSSASNRMSCMLSFSYLHFGL